MTGQSQRLTIGRILAFPFTVFGRILRIIIWLILIIAIVMVGVAGVWLMGKVENASGSAPRWKVKQTWFQGFMDMPGICKSGYGMGILALPMMLVVDPIVELTSGNITLAELPGRIEILWRDFWEKSQKPIGKCPALFPPDETLIID